MLPELDAANRSILAIELVDTGVYDVFSRAHEFV
jgi:hypothetical protein